MLPTRPIDTGMILLVDNVHDQLWYFDESQMSLQPYLDLYRDDFFITSGIFTHYSTQSLFFFQQPVDWDVSNAPELMQLMRLDLRTGNLRPAAGLPDTMLAFLLPLPNPDFSILSSIADYTLPSNANACLFEAFSERCFLMPSEFERLLLHTPNFINQDNYLVLTRGNDNEPGIYQFDVENMIVEPILENDWAVIDSLGYSAIRHQFVAIGERETVHSSTRNYTFFTIDLSTGLVSNLPYETLGPVLGDDEINVSSDGRFIQYSGIGYYAVIDFETGELLFFMEDENRNSTTYESIWLDNSHLLLTMSVNHSLPNTLALIDIETQTLEEITTLPMSFLVFHIVE